MIPKLYRFLRLHLDAKRAYAGYLILRRRVLVREIDWRTLVVILRYRTDAAVSASIACNRGG